MNKPHESVFCSRCGDELTADEIAQAEGPICAFCETIRAEALEIHEHRHTRNKPKVRKPLNIATSPSDKTSLKFDAPLLTKIIRPTTT